ncbi:hypothetical protein PAPHI01_0906 [Pancytospora philotis]|nr:hypothetical protein PAPHI01_0906 [Pancytospora philotis]
MSTQIQKVVHLVRKAHGQPILFHMLLAHLAHVLKAVDRVYEATDDWSKVILASCAANKLPNQGLELKMQVLVRKLRPPHDSPDSRLKTMLICYYLMNRPARLINHIMLFELVSHYMGISAYLDGLVISILSRFLTAGLYGVEKNKKARDDTVEKMLAMLARCELSEANRVRALACFAESGVKPLPVDFIDFQPTLFSYKCFEYAHLYAKYAAETAHIKDTFPAHPEFMEGLRAFMEGTFSFDAKRLVAPKDCVLENSLVCEQIKSAFNAASDKRRFVSSIVEFVMGLSSS